jgi:RNA polymerase sigma factor (sigma-70 family)
MKHTIEFKHFEPRERARKLVEELTARLEKQIKDFPQDSVFLRALIEENPVRKIYHVSITLDLPGGTLAAKEELHDPVETIRDAFNEIERQIERHKARLRRDYLWKRPARRDELRRKTSGKTAPPEESKRELFISVIEPHLKTLYNFARREIAYHEANGDLIAGEVTTDEAVDETVVRAYEKLPTRPSNMELDRWLMKLAMEFVDSEVKRSRAERKKFVHIEEDIPETPPTEEVSTLGDEILDFYQPDEDLKLEDIIPDFEVSLPEEEAERNELRNAIRNALASLPGAWRKAFVLHYVEGLSMTEAAKVIGLPEAEIKRYIEFARATLRQKLIESGLSVNENKGRGDAESKASAMR